MLETKPAVTLELWWDGDLRFRGRSGALELTLDSASQAGPSPMQAVAFGIAGCMAVDVVHILTKGRHPFSGVRATLTGSRAEEVPRRFVGIVLHFVVTGDVAPQHVERAVALSTEKYCSVWHSLRQDIAFTCTSEVEAAATRQ